MAEVKGPLYSRAVKGSVGDMVFDRRGFIRLKGFVSDAQTPSQGNIRQTMAAAQKAIKACGITTRAQLKALAADESRWNGYLLREIIGVERSHFLDAMAGYATLDTGDRLTWEMAAKTIGLKEVRIKYADEAPISAGAQLFLIAQTLFSLGLYTKHGAPTGDNANRWQASVAT
jgi:hypothetical protein